MSKWVIMIMVGMLILYGGVLVIMVCMIIYIVSTCIR